jgi:multiple sugar transport system permease protein
LATDTTGTAADQRVHLGGQAHFERAAVRRSWLSPQASRRLRRRGIYLGVAIIALWTVLPFLWLITCSLSNTVDLLSRPPRFIPWPPTLTNYRTIFFGTASNGGFAEVSAQLVPLGLRNSIEVSLAVTVVNVIVGSLAGYAYARYQSFAFMNGTLWVLMMTRMIPGLALAVPFFILFRTVHLLDSKVALVIAYTSFILPLTVWIMKGYFETVPVSLERAALVDGCSRLRAFLQIIVPVALPGIAAAAIFCFLVSWNEFLFALILTSTGKSQTIPIVISGFTQQARSTQYGSIFASGVVAVLPPVLIALLFQKYLVQGMLSGSTKG